MCQYICFVFYLHFIKGVNTFPAMMLIYKVLKYVGIKVLKTKQKNGKEICPITFISCASQVWTIGRMKRRVVICPIICGNIYSIDQNTGNKIEADRGKKKGGDRYRWTSEVRYYKWISWQIQNKKEQKRSLNDTLVRIGFRDWLVTGPNINSFSLLLKQDWK